MKTVHISKRKGMVVLASEAKVRRMRMETYAAKTSVKYNEALEVALKFGADATGPLVGRVVRAA